MGVGVNVKRNRKLFEVRLLLITSVGFLRTTLQFTGFALRVRHE
jgi:hypothetical protein